jgi:branched-chain amino acid aminotransferase
MESGLTVFSISSGSKSVRLDFQSAPKTLDDVSRQLPQGLYSTFRTLDGCRKVLGLSTHLDRLYKPARPVEASPSVSRGELREMLKQILVAYQPGDARIRVSLALDETPGQIFIALEPLKLLPESVYQHGIKVITTEIARAAPRLKSTAFIQSSESERQALRKAGMEEALMVRNGHILEGLTSNFYSVAGEKLITARYGILLGVTRRAVLRLARSAGLRIEYRPLRMAELPSIDEAFITSSSRAVVPVVEVNGMPIGQGRPGNVAKMLRRAYDQYVLDRAESL